MDTEKTNGWQASAAAWIADIGETGDYGRQYVLDRPMLDRVHSFRRALDVGCGEGRFCRMMQEAGLQTVGIDPTEAFIEEARRRDPGGDYRLGKAEDLGFPDASFDLVVSYLTLIDIPDIRRAIAEMSRVLTPGGSLLIANLTSFNTAGVETSWIPDPTGQLKYGIDRYLEERSAWVSWRGIRVQNYHRPLSTYMTLLLEQGLLLRHFSEPRPYGGDPAQIEHYSRVPYFMMMEWQKPLS